MTENNTNEIELYGIHYGTDKIYDHGYHRFYNKELLEYKNMQNIGILEIGVDGFASINMWKSYFRNAFIYGIDINKEYKDDTIHVFKADQSNINSLENIKNQLNHPIFFINDDGSHIHEHQLLSFDYLFSNVLQEGGIYIIEDIEVSYWRRGELYGYQANYGVGNTLSIVEKFKLLIDYVNHPFFNENDKKILDENTQFLSTKTKESILSINFSENCIIIKKRHENDLKYHNPYRFAHFV
jgi:hypothetical protein